MEEFYQVILLLALATTDVVGYESKWSHCPYLRYLVLVPCLIFVLLSAAVITLPCVAPLGSDLAFNALSTTDCIFD